MNDQFAQLAMMQPQGPAPTPPPTAGPVGGRLAQLWEAFKTDPNMRQAVLHAGAAMSQSPPAGQNAFGMIGAGIERGALTFDALKERQRAQGIDDERFAEQIGLKRQGVNLQERSLDEQIKTRGEDREFRSEELRRGRKQEARMQMANAALQKELMDMRMSVDRAGHSATHPNVHLVDTLGNVLYAANTDYYENLGKERGVDPLAIAKEDYINKMHGAKDNPQLANEIKARTFQSWFEERMKNAELFGNQPTAEEVQGVLALLEEGFTNYLQPGAPRVSQPSVRSEQPPTGQNQSPWPPGGMSPLGENRSPNAAGMQEIESWSRLANSGATRRDRQGRLVRLTRSGNDFFFIGLDEQGNETERQLATTDQIRGFVNMPGR